MGCAATLRASNGGVLLGFQQQSWLGNDGQLPSFKLVPCLVKLVAENASSDRVKWVGFQVGFYSFLYLMSEHASPFLAYSFIYLLFNRLTFFLFIYVTFLPTYKYFVLKFTYPIRKDKDTMLALSPRVPR